MKDDEEREMHVLAERLAMLTRGTGWEAYRYAMIGQTMDKLAEYCAVEPRAESLAKVPGAHRRNTPQESNALDVNRTAEALGRTRLDVELKETD